MMIELLTHLGPYFLLALRQKVRRLVGRDPPVLIVVCLYKEQKPSGPGPTTVFIFFVKAAKKTNQKKRLARGGHFYRQSDLLLVIKPDK